MKSNPDLRVRFEPDAVQDSRTRRNDVATWLPEAARTAARLDPVHWMTRSARGFSWNRAGIVVSRDLHR